MEEKNITRKKFDPSEAKITTGTYDSIEQLKEKAKREGAIVFGDESSSAFNLQNYDSSQMKEYDTEEVWKNVVSMRKYILSQSEIPTLDEASNKYPYLYKEFPSIFRMVYTGNNLELIRSMLDTIKDMKKGKINFLNASRKVAEDISAFQKK